MIDLNFKECCKECKHRATYVHETKLHCDSSVYAVVTVIGCIHEKTCGKYLAEEV